MKSVAHVRSIVPSLPCGCAAMFLTLAVALGTTIAPRNACAAGTYYVDVDNPNANDAGPGTEAEPYRTIGTADHIRGGPGTTILVKPGTYFEDVRIDHSGSAAEPYVIRASGTGVVMIGTGPANSYNAFRLYQKHDVVIEGFEIQSYFVGIYLFQTTAATIRGNRISQMTTQGINVSYGNARIEGNTVFLNGDHGIVLLGSPGSQVIGNESYSNGGTNHPAANGIRAFDSARCRFERNRLHNNADSGLDLSAAFDALSIQNISWNNGDHGFSVLNSSGSRQLNDVAWNNNHDGFSFEGGSTRCQMWNCIAVDAGTQGYHCVFVDSSSTEGHQSNYNIVWSVTGSSPVRYGGVTYPTLYAFQQATGLDGASRQSNPLFVDPTAGDFHVQSGSKAIDSGFSGLPDWPLTDASGAPRNDDPGTPNSGLGPITYSERGALEFVRSGPVAVEDRLVTRIALGQPFPNPGRSAIAASLELPRGGRVVWSVRDVTGRTVWQESAELAAGRSMLRWSGSDASGRAVPPGVYVLSVEAGGSSAARRFAVVR